MRQAITCCSKPNTALKCLLAFCGLHWSAAGIRRSGEGIAVARTSLRNLWIYLRPLSRKNNGARHEPSNCVEKSAERWQTVPMATISQSLVAFAGRATVSGYRGTVSRKARNGGRPPLSRVPRPFEKMCCQGDTLFDRTDSLPGSRSRSRRNAASSCGRRPSPTG